jgi:hypothetical protein
VTHKTDKFKSAAAAILFLLDNWKPEPPTASRPTPKKKRKK